jgi:hypothetical protein
MKWTAKSIAREGPARYRVILECDGNIRAFEFSVLVIHGMNMVQWGEDFSRFMQMNTVAATPLLAAVQAFHLAQHTPFPGEL